jgi:uncharacterized alpha-E superfamily protein
MLSRVAEDLYWMARYLERAENTARLINATGHVLLDLPRDASFGWNVLVRVLGLDSLSPQAETLHGETKAMEFLIAARANPSSILSCVHCARENCRKLRDVLPREAWEHINAAYLALRRNAPQTAGRAARRRILEELIRDCQAVAGLLSECMSHDVAYQFIRLGEHIERADMTTRILDIHAAVLVPRQQVPEDPAIALLWVGVLKSLSAFQMYRRHGFVQVTSAGVVRYLIKDAHFPRSVTYCLDTIETHLAELPNNAKSMRALRTARRRVDGLTLEALSAELRHDWLDTIQTDLAQVHEQIADAYFHLHHKRSDSTAAPVAASGHT